MIVAWALVLLLAALLVERGAFGRAWPVARLAGATALGLGAGGGLLYSASTAWLAPARAAAVADPGASAIPRVESTPGAATAATAAPASAASPLPAVSPPAPATPSPAARPLRPVPIATGVARRTTLR